MTWTIPLFVFLALYLQTFGTRGAALIFALVQTALMLWPPGHAPSAYQALETAITCAAAYGGFVALWGLAGSIAIELIGAMFMSVLVESFPRFVVTVLRTILPLG